jgi:hypothetical protein
MRTFWAGLIGTFVAAAVGVGAMQGAALAQAAPSTPSAGDGGVAAGQAVVDFLDALRSGQHTNNSNPGAGY